jgi:membrane-bound lytic murein transglycosylase B
LTGIEPIARVVELDRNQPEFKLSFAEYLARVAPQSRVEKGRRLLEQNRELLGQLYERYGVQPRFLVALWGVESDFGRTLGSFDLIPALATLAFDGRRGAYFRGELMDALRILDAGHVDPAEFKGSWAGALGQCQFMPSTFMRHAVDFDGDGRCDIWHSTGDALASAANYLAKMGWSGDRIWGRRVELPGQFDPALTGLKIRKRLSEWQALGVRRAGGSDLPKAPDLMASVIQPSGEGGPAYVVYDNFTAIMNWNRSIYFATALGILSDQIGRRGS